MLLMKTKDLLFDATVLPVNGIRTISWWLTRLLLMHQRILDERSSSLYDLLKVLCMIYWKFLWLRLYNILALWKMLVLIGATSCMISILQRLFQHFIQKQDCKNTFTGELILAGELSSESFIFDGLISGYIRKVFSWKHVISNMELACRTLSVVADDFVHCV